MTGKRPVSSGKAFESGAAPLPESQPVVLQVSGDLDLHTFRPRDLPELLPAWFEECRAQGIRTVRVIHGKGTGTLRTGVHRLLEKMTLSPTSPSHFSGVTDPQQPEAATSMPNILVESWAFPAPETAGGWGTTLVYLHPEDDATCLRQAESKSARPP